MSAGYLLYDKCLMYKEVSVHCHGIFSRKFVFYHILSCLEHEYNNN
jgi:hypothetical protein